MDIPPGLGESVLEDTNGYNNAENSENSEKTWNSNWVEGTFDGHLWWVILLSTIFGVSRYKQMQLWARGSLTSLHPGHLMEFPLPNFDVPTTSAHKGTKMWENVFHITTACECKKFKQILLKQVGFECPHHLRVSPPLTLHPYNNKELFTGSHHPPKILGQKVESNY